MTTEAKTTPAPPPTLDEISGKVSHLAFQKPTFCAGRIMVRHREVSFNVKGYVKIGEPVTLRGKWITHPKWGRQFEATEVVYTTPADPAGVKVWLEWYCPDVGPVKAQQMVDEFGMGLLEMASVDPAQVAAFARIPIESVHRIAKEWSVFQARASCMGELARFGLTQHQAEQVYARLKGSAVTVLREDPYLLLREVEGFGWKTVDALAKKLGTSPTHPGRLRAAAITAVVQAQDNGSTALLHDAAVSVACDLCELPEAEYAAKVTDEIHTASNKGLLKVVSRSGNRPPYLALPSPHRHESLIWDRLGTARSANPHVPGDAAAFADPYREVVVGGRVCVLDETQHEAVVAAARHQMVFITGGAGAGKTLVAKAIHTMFHHARVNVRLAAPTGKAARRLTDVIGREATTIHRLLEYNPHEGGFTFNERYQLPSGVVIVDEVSMVDSELMFHLLSACGTNISLVFIGDPNQLPPVGAGAVLRDVIDRDLAPVVKLGHCHRQAGPLKTNCNAILSGRVEPTVAEDASPWMVHQSLATPDRVVTGITRLFTEYLPQWGFDPITDTQFLTAKHAGPMGTTHLNRVCQRLRQAQLGVELPEPDPTDEGRPVLHPGDKVMQTKNNYLLDVMNGTQGVVVATTPNLVVRFDDKDVQYPPENRGEVSLAYVITPWKAQGSEWPCVVSIIPKSHAFMQHRNFLYTACTRAKRTCIILGDEDGIRRAAERVENDRRQTLLQVWSGEEVGLS